jgi:bacterioferritin-associated ferredoxin
MIICSCKATSDRTIHRLIREGNITLEALGALTGAGTDCGSCVNALHYEIDRVVTEEPEILSRTKVALPAGLTSPAPNRTY